VPIAFDEDAPLIGCAVDGLRGTCTIDTGNTGETIVEGHWAARSGLARRLANGLDAYDEGRPHVSNDNRFIESHYKTLKYCPTYPGAFANIEQARAYCRRRLREAVAGLSGPPWRHTEAVLHNVPQHSNRPPRLHRDVDFIERRLVKNVARIVDPSDQGRICAPVRPG